MSTPAATRGKLRIGLFGGSFDPVHLGHLLMAQAALEELQLARIYFIPAAQSPFKQAQRHAPAPMRVRLLRLALAGQTRYEVDEQEIRRGGVSYTVDTLRDYVSRWRDAEFFCLIGADNVATLPQWRESDALARLTEFAVIPRPGELTTAFPSPFRGQVLKGFPLTVSSSQIRARTAAGQSLDLLVPPAVAEAIHNNRLYL